MLSVNMRRTGSKKRSFRVVVSKPARRRRVHRSPRHNPRTKPAVVEINEERIAHWIKSGARPSGLVRTLLAKHLTKDRAIVDAPVTAGPTAPKA